MKRTITAFTLVLVLAAAGARATHTATHAWTQTVVATGLDSPRGLTIAPDGTVYAAEAGHGGDVCNAHHDCIGTTARISKIDPASGAVSPVVTGLWSNGGPEGSTGVDGISAGGGRLTAVMTAAPQQFTSFTCGAGAPADCQSVVDATKAQAGELLEFTNGGTWRAVAGVGSNDFDLTTKDPSLSSEGPNANPYGVLALKGGTWVADAGANLLDWVLPNGQIDVSSRIEKSAPGGFPGDGVPTCLAMLRGNLYAADLGGRLWKRDGQFSPTRVDVVDASGKPLIHHVTGCVSDGLDHLYLVDMWGTPGPPIPAGPQSVAGTGSVVEVTRDGAAQVIASGLDFPNGIALAKDGSLYVSVDSICGSSGTPLPTCGKGGQIIRLQP
jgi:glucose/arabinose dehydrogenase